MLSTYKLKDALQRGGTLLGAVVLLAGLVVTAFPASVFADALNPLTERSLKLSSSSPGWSFKDGSGNDTYAPPHSGANGQKTGNEFSFRMSTPNVVVKAMTFQYCTTPAGTCVAPGDNGHGDGTGTLTLIEDDDEVSGDGTQFLSQLTEGAIIVTAGGNQYVVDTIDSNTTLTLTTTATENESDVAFTYANQNDTDSTSDLNVVTGSGPEAPAQIGEEDWEEIRDSASKTPPRDNSLGNFVILRADAGATMSAIPEWDEYEYAQDDAWTMAASNVESGSFSAGTKTGKNNFITITSSVGEQLSASLDGDLHGDYFKIIFFGTDHNYITNPGSGSFFVRMNTYADEAMTQPIDGGVTVANVMNESITIRTRVQETMDFSVGTYDPTLYTNSQLNTIGKGNHAQCKPLLMANPTADGVNSEATFNAQEHNVIYMGDPGAENSLSTQQPYSAQSYWRLSSNSSGGATVYYTGHTLTNTVGDEIKPLGETPTKSEHGTEQFGLAIAHGTDEATLGFQIYPVWLAPGESYGDEEGTDGDGDFASYLFGEYDSRGTDLAGIDEFAHYPRLYPLIPLAPYNNGAGVNFDGSIATGDGDAADFAFNANADTYAIPLATNNEQVVNCVTAKMRYIANIAATTPAGIYTTKINYVAAPQY